MRILFILLLLIHGVLHLPGWVKAFGLAEVKPITQSISISFGFLWFVAFVFFTGTALFFIFNYRFWWLLGLIAAGLSQLLILFFWQDAKFGTIANALILFSSLYGYGTWCFYGKYRNEVNLNLQQVKLEQNSILREIDLQYLPEPVKKYIRYTGGIGKPKIHSFYVSFAGKIRKNEQSAWMPFASEQYNFIKSPVRLFFMKATMNHVPVRGYHSYKLGEAFMDIRLLSLVKVQYMEGQEMNEAETVTFFNDMCCLAPATLIDPRIKWLEVDGNTVKASLTIHAITITAWLLFNDRGELINFVSNDRYASDAGKKLPWSTPLKNYKAIHGYILVGDADAIYQYPDGEQCYGTFHTLDVVYNPVEIHTK